MCVFMFTKNDHVELRDLGWKYEQHQFLWGTTGFGCQQRSFLIHPEPTAKQNIQNQPTKTTEAIDPIESDSIHLSWKCPNDSNLTSPLVDQSFPRSSCQVEWESIILLVVARKCPWIIHSYKLLASYHWLFSVCIHLVHTYYLCSFINVIYLHIRILMYLYTHLT